MNVSLQTAARFIQGGAIIAYGVLMSIYAFPGNDFMMALSNPIGFDTIVPYPFVYVGVVGLFIFLFYSPDCVASLVRRHQKREASS